LLTNDSLSVSQLSIGSGRALLPLNQSDNTPSVGGGGAIAVVWTDASPATPLTASFVQVVLYNNTVAANVTGEGSGLVMVGGGAILVYGSGATMAVQLRECTLYDNGVLFADGSALATVTGFGGAVGVLTGSPVALGDDVVSWEVEPVAGVDVDVVATSAAGNFLWREDGNGAAGE
jgi:hypothetical protein